MAKHSILIINPNTSEYMTDGLKPIVDNLNYTDVHFDYFSAPDEPTAIEPGAKFSGLPSINSGEDSALSALHCIPHLKPLVGKYDAFLVACFSAHPLVGMLKDAVEEYELQQTASAKRNRKHVIGIFEASVSTCLVLTTSFNLSPSTDMERSLDGSSAFGIVTTGDGWKAELNSAVRRMLLRGEGNAEAAVDLHNFAGVETTGLTAIELHNTPADEVRGRIKGATERLINDSSQPVTAICLGCAGMAGMEEAVRMGCVRSLGLAKGSRVVIVDGVVAGIGILVNACKAGF